LGTEFNAGILVSVRDSQRIAAIATMLCLGVYATDGGPNLGGPEESDRARVFPFQPRFALIFRTKPWQ